MLSEPTMEKLRALKLDALATAWSEQRMLPHVATLGFDDRLGLLVDVQYLAVHNKRLELARKEAKLRLQSASLESLDTPELRGLEKAQLAQLQTGQYIEPHLSVLVCGPTGTGKTFVSWALGEQACRQAYRVLYVRVPRLLEDPWLQTVLGKRAALIAPTMLRDPGQPFTTLLPGPWDCLLRSSSFLGRLLRLDSPRSEPQTPPPSLALPLPTLLGDAPHFHEEAPCSGQLPFRKDRLLQLNPNVMLELLRLHGFSHF